MPNRHPLLYYFQCSQKTCFTNIRGARAQRMGGVWGREEETEDEETAGEEEEAEDTGKEEEEEKEVSWRGGSTFGDGEAVSYEDEEVNQALVVNIKEKITKLEERVSLWQHHQHHENHCFKVIEKEAGLKKRLEAQEVFKIPFFFSSSLGRVQNPQN